MQQRVQQPGEHRGVLDDPQRSQTQDLLIEQAIKKWLNAPFRFRGTSSCGCDCLGFLIGFMKDIHGSKIPDASSWFYRPGWSQHTPDDRYIKGIRELCHLIEPNEAKTGDVLYFQCENTIDHAGVYLDKYHGKRKSFIHCYRARGVQISNLDERYWKQTFRGAARLKIRTR